MNLLKKISRRNWIALGAIALGFLVAQWLVAKKPSVQRSPSENPGILVEILELKAKAQKLERRAQGQVLPARTIPLRTEVGGRVIALHENLLPGGQFQAGEVLFSIDPRDYEAQVAQQEAALDQARVELELERGRASVATREWELLGDASSQHQPNPALARREPQLRAAELAVKAAQASLEQAQLNLSRTQVRAPFASVIQQEEIDLGQLISPQEVLGQLVGTDAYWVQVALPRSDWEQLGAQGNQKAAVWVPEVPEPYPAQVLGLLPAVAEVGRMAQVLVEIPKPLAREGSPVLLGTFVEVQLQGLEIENAFRIPRSALQNDSEVYLLREDQTLEIRNVTVAFRHRDEVVIQGGLQDGELLIISRLATPIEGMKLRVAEKDLPPQAQAQAASRSP